MKNYFFEISPVALNRGLVDYQYLAVYDENSDDVCALTSYGLVAIADRIWEETNEGIYFIKNRYVSTDTPVDTMEFLLVKLKSRNIQKNR